MDLYVPGLQAEIINVKLIPPTFSSNNEQSLSIIVFDLPLKQSKSGRLRMVFDLSTVDLVMLSAINIID